jgi:hypothetical protein
MRPIADQIPHRSEAMLSAIADDAPASKPFARENSPRIDDSVFNVAAKSSTEA